jgi:hypothetical protein
MKGVDYRPKDSRLGVQLEEGDVASPSTGLVANNGFCSKIVANFSLLPLCRIGVGIDHSCNLREANVLLSLDERTRQGPIRTLPKP